MSALMLTLGIPISSSGKTYVVESDESGKASTGVANVDGRKDVLGNDDDSFIFETELTGTEVTGRGSSSL